MNELFGLILWMGLPTAAVQSAFLLAERRVAFTGRLADRLTFLRMHKAAVQLASVLVFILGFGTVCLLCGIRREVYFAVCGAYIGLINGVAVAVMHED